MAEKMVPTSKGSIRGGKVKMTDPQDAKLTGGKK